MRCPHTNSLHGTEEHNTGQRCSRWISRRNHVLNTTFLSAVCGYFGRVPYQISRGSSTRPLSEIEAMWTLRCRNGRMRLGLAESRGVSGLTCPLLGVPLALLLATTWYGHGKNLQKLWFKKPLKSVPYIYANLNGAAPSSIETTKWYVLLTVHCYVVFFLFEIHPVGQPFLKTWLMFNSVFFSVFLVHSYQISSPRKSYEGFWCPIPINQWRW